MNRVIGLIYDAILDPSRWPEILEEVATSCGGMGLVIGPIAPSSDTDSYIYTSRDLLELTNSFFRDWHHASPSTVYNSRQPLIGRSIWDGDVYSLDEMKRLPFYHDFVHRFEVAHCMMRGTAPLGHSGRYAFMTPTPFNHGPPDDGQRRIYDLLTSHLEKALGMYLQINARGQSFENAISLIGGQDGGIILLDDCGDIKHVNEAAARMAGDGFQISGGRLVAALPGQQPALDKLLLNAAVASVHAIPGGPLPLKRANGKKPLLVNAMPAQATGGSNLTRFFSRRDIVVVLVDPELEVSKTHPDCFLSLGLTPAEARVASILGTGASPETAANMLQTTVGTVRNQLKSVFSKLDISRQGELVAIASRLSILQR